VLLCGCEGHLEVMGSKPVQGSQRRSFALLLGGAGGLLVAAALEDLCR
jgi:hypothetical protein